MKTLFEIKNDFVNHLRHYGTFEVAIDDDMICVSSSSLNSVLSQSVLSFIVYYCTDYHLHFQVNFVDNIPELLIYF